MGLKELDPELAFRHLIRNTLRMLPTDGRIRLEDGFNNIRGDIIFKAITVRLRLDPTLQSKLPLALL